MSQFERGMGVGALDCELEPLGNTDRSVKLNLPLILPLAIVCIVPSMTSPYRDGEPYQLAERQMLAELAQVFGDKRLSPAVELGAKVKEAPGLHQSIFELAPSSPQARAYGHLVNRVYS